MISNVQWPLLNTSVAIHTPENPLGPYCHQVLQFIQFSNAPYANLKISHHLSTQVTHPLHDYSQRLTQARILYSIYIPIEGFEWSDALKGWTNSPITPKVDLIALVPYANIEVVQSPNMRRDRPPQPVLSIIKTNGPFNGRVQTYIVLQFYCSF